MAKRSDDVLASLMRLRNEESIRGMARYGIVSKSVLGISMPDLRAMAREIGKDHDLALSLWESGVHEARILAGLIDDPKKVSEEQMDRWAQDFDNWAVCDGICIHLFRRTPYAYRKCHEWSTREEEYVKRAGFTLMATLAVHDKKAPDSRFNEFLSAIERESIDDRRYVKKAVNWALRQVGKRSRYLHVKALHMAEERARSDSRSARWIGSDAVAELSSPKVVARFE